MKIQTDLELKSIVEQAIDELYSRGYNIELRGTLGRSRQKPVLECTKVIKL
jgi:hypothetical protein